MVVLNLIDLFKPKKSFFVSLRQPTSKEVMKRLPISEEPLPLPAESKQLCFEHEGVPILTVQTSSFVLQRSIDVWR